MTIWWLPLLAVLLTLVLVPMVRRYSISRGLVDLPGARRSHDRPVPRGGGLAIVCALVLGVAAGPWQEPLLLVFVGGLVVSSILGWIDDHGSLPVGWRLTGQACISIAAVALLGPVESISVLNHSIQANLVWSMLAVIALIWLMNLFNFMDGADGLAASQTLISALLFASVFWLNSEPLATWLALMMAGCSGAFLAWNWPPARIFLGDSGSLPLGWGMGILALAGTLLGTISVVHAFIIVSPFVVDATLTLARRVAAGEQWYTPHRSHAYQCLIRTGWSHQRVLWLWWGINLLLVAPAAVLVANRPALDLAVGLLLACLLAGFWFVAHKRAAIDG